MPKVPSPYLEDNTTCNDAQLNVSANDEWPRQNGRNTFFKDQHTECIAYIYIYIYIHTNTHTLITYN